MRRDYWLGAEGRGHGGETMKCGMVAKCGVKRGVRFGCGEG